MKILYFGLADELAESVIQELGKEGHAVYSILDKKKKIKGIKSKVYEYNVRSFDSQIKNIMTFVKPGAVVFAGRSMNNLLHTGDTKDFDQLNHILQLAVKTGVKKIVYLSSLDVKKIKNKEKDLSEWAMYHAQQEYMLKLAAQKSEIQATILRCAPIFYGRETSELKASKPIFDSKGIIQPVHVKDVAIAVSRMLDEERGNVVLDVCGSKAFVKEEDKEQNHISSCQNKYKNDEIKKMISWTDFNEFHPDDHMLEEDIPDKAKGKRKKESEKIDNQRRRFIRQLFENFVLFALFLIPQILLREHSLFQQINFMLVYIVVIALYLGMIQSTIAVILASAAYLLVNGINIMEITSIYSYLKYLIIVAEYIFFGISVSYANNMIRNRLVDKKMDYDLLREDYEELKKVYEQNTRITEEYEQRMIRSKTTLPKIQSIMSKLNVLQPDKIFMEVNYVVSELLRTKTVAVYRKDNTSSYLRLLASLNEESTFGGKTWNLENFSEILSKIEKKEIAMGNAWSEEPAMTIPINNGDACIAVIVVKELSLETRSLYYLNMMRTLAALVSEAMTRALEYQSLIESRRYIDGTPVLTAEEFQKQVMLQREMKASKISTYSVLHVPIRNWRKVYLSVDHALRTVDYIGVNKEEELLVILVNTANEECNPVIERLEKLGIVAQIEE